MPRKIDKDHDRFRQIVRGRIRQELRKYVTRGHLLGKKGKDTVSIPMPQIELPRFIYGSKETGGVGQGDGEVGDPIGKGDPGQPGAGQAGELPGEHTLEVEVPLDELAEILGEELALPRIEPKGKQLILAEKHRYNSIRTVGPESLRHFKRTYRQALKRQISAGTYDIDDPIVIPYREDRRYRSFSVRELPESNAVIVYMMDVSGSMGDEQKEIVRIEAFWIDTWLRSQYRNIESVYIVHDAVAREVDEHTFYHLRESGGTRISSAYELTQKILSARYPVLDWNIYPFHFSDGDNWGTEDTERCVRVLSEAILPDVNVFCYGQVRSAYGSGKFKGDLDAAFPDDERVITSDIPNRDGIWNSIKDFLGAGK